MAGNFNVSFNGKSSMNVEQYSYSQSNLGHTASTGTMNGVGEVDYGEAEEFDYESYLDSENGSFDVSSFYKDQAALAQETKKSFEETLREIENEKKRLENAYLEVMMIGSNESMSELMSFDGYKYATIDDYIKYYQDLIDPNSCMDSNYMFSQEIYNQKMAEAEKNARRDYEERFNRCFEQAMGMTYEEYQDRIEEINNDISTLKSMKYTLEQKLKESPYLEMMQTSDFQNYKNNNSSKNLESLITDYVNSTYSSTYLGGSYDTTATINTIMNQLRYNLLSDDDKMMCLYLYEKEGLGAAYNYVNAIEDRLNQVAGSIEANKFIESISTNGKIDVNLWNGAKTSGKGLTDGIENFGEGLLNVFTTEGMISSNQYGQMYILEALNESKMLSATYQFSMSAGNMVPAMTVSALVSAIASPGAGSIVGSSLMGFSAGGNAKNQALVDGNSLVESYIYGGCIGLSETTLGYFLGKMPGLSKSSGFTLKNLFMEGLEEFSQEWVEAGLQVAVLNQDVDWSKIPEQSVSSFVMGFLMAGLFDGGQAGIALTINSISYTINVQKTLDYINAHPEISMEQAFLEANNISMDSTKVETNPTSDTTAHSDFKFHDVGDFFSSNFETLDLEGKKFYIKNCKIDALDALIMQGVLSEDLVETFEARLIRDQDQVIEYGKDWLGTTNLGEYIATHSEVLEKITTPNLLPFLVAANGNIENIFKMELATRVQAEDVSFGGGHTLLFDEATKMEYALHTKLFYESKMSQATYDILFAKIKDKVRTYLPDSIRTLNYGNFFQQEILATMLQNGKIDESVCDLVLRLSDSGKNLSRFNFNMLDTEILSAFDVDFVLEIGNYDSMSSKIVSLKNNYPKVFEAYAEIIKLIGTDNSLGNFSQISESTLNFMFENASQIENIDLSSPKDFVNYILYNDRIFRETEFSHQNEIKLDFSESYWKDFAAICDERFDALCERDTLYDYEMISAKDLFFQKYFSLKYDEVQVLLFRYAEHLNEVTRFADESSRLALETLNVLRTINEMTSIEELKSIYNTMKISLSPMEMLHVDASLKAMYNKDYCQALRSTDNAIQARLSDGSIEYVEYNGTKVPIIPMQGEFSFLVHSSGTGFKTKNMDSGYISSWNEVLGTTHAISTSFITNENLGTAPIVGDGVLYAFTDIQSEDIAVMAPYDLASYVYKYGFVTDQKQRYVSASKMGQETLRVYNEFLLDRTKVKPNYIILYENATVESYNSTLQAASEWGVPILKMDTQQIAQQQVSRINDLLSQFSQSKDVSQLETLLNLYEANLSGYKLNENRADNATYITDPIDYSNLSGLFESIPIESTLENYITELVSNGDSTNLMKVQEILTSIQQRYDMVTMNATGGAEGGAGSLVPTKASFDISRFQNMITSALGNGG